MGDNDINDESEETKKRKKIRRILLLKTDEQLKTKSKKKYNIMINSRTIREINNNYNLYNILLSEKTKYYFNYVKTEEKIVANNISQSQMNTSRVVSKEKKLEKPNKLLNKSFDEDSINSPILNFVPQKIHLGIQKFDMKKVSQNNENNLPNSIQNNCNLEKVESKEGNMGNVNKSTKVEKRGLFRLVDKIINIKMNENIEKVIKKNILKLRKYCNNLKQPKKIKKLNKQNTQSVKKNGEERIKKRGNIKRMTMSDNKNIFKKPLFEKDNPEKINDNKIKRVHTRINTTKHLDMKSKEMKEMKEMKEKDIQKEKDKIAEHEKHLLRVTSYKIIKKMNSINKDKNPEPPPNKRKIRKMQTLTGDMKNKFGFNKIKVIKFSKNSEINKNDDSIPSTYKLAKNHLLSSKFERPKFPFNNSNNINNINFKNIATKVKTKSKFIQNDKSNKNFISTNRENTKDKKEKKDNIITCFKERNEKNRHSTKKSKKNSINIYNKFLHFSKKEEKIKNIPFDKNISFDENEDEINKMNILSDFIKK